MIKVHKTTYLTIGFVFEDRHQTLTIQPHIKMDLSSEPARYVFEVGMSNWKLGSIEKKDGFWRPGFRLDTCPCWPYELNADDLDLIGEYIETYLPEYLQ
ncbi:hypothetical protein [Desertivirga arenae]|uniref:hypothetical protein n=1 Tax=Desertivirga arenae TaxID=2810309 RepID=UPI001A959F67|nr:hypothetical protein [Pedobacter sp. SYSU D00823]